METTNVQREICPVCGGSGMIWHSRTLITNFVPGSVTTVSFCRDCNGIGTRPVEPQPDEDHLNEPDDFAMLGGSGVEPY